MMVYVLDRVGYDVRGGNAQVFATAEAAKASVRADIVWDDLTDDDGWMEHTPPTSADDIWVIYKREVFATAAHWCEVCKKLHEAPLHYANP